MKNFELTEYVDRLYAAAVRKTGDSAVAEELAQETFLAALQAIRRGFAPENPWAWLLRVLSNKYCDWLREKYSRPMLSFDDGYTDIADGCDAFAADDEYAVQLESIRRALGYLAKTHREVMVRFYMRGHTIERIAGELGIPPGTVKSRLSTGRQQVREGVNEMENYTKQSYEPDILYISCSGDCGLDSGPFSLVRPDDRLAQNILIMAYDKPVTEAELAKALGIPSAYIEPVVEKLVNGELMCRTDGGKVFTAFIMYTVKEMTANLKEQLEAADVYFELFWKHVAAGLRSLREADYYKRQSSRAQKKLELHFAVNTLSDACVIIRDEVTGPLPFEDYPYRKDGGRWYAMGFRYAPDHNFNDSLQKYMISGEARIELRNFNGARLLQLRKYDTDLGGYPTRCFQSDYLQWLYEIERNVPPESSAVSPRVLEAAGALIDSGVLFKNGSVLLDIPVLTSTAYYAKRALSNEYSAKAAAAVREIMLKLYNEGHVRLPKHLTGVPKFQQYMYSGNSVPMAVIFKAIEKGLFLENVDYPVPASILVADE